MNYTGICMGPGHVEAINIPSDQFNWDTFEHNGHNVTWSAGQQPPDKTIDSEPKPAVDSTLAISMPAVIIKDESKPTMTDDEQFQADVQAIKTAMARLSTIALEREDAIKALFTCLIAKQHIVFYGEGGTGKNWLVERFSKMIDMNYFYYQIFQATTENHLFGSIDYRKMRESGEMSHVKYNSMLEAQIAFLDEIGNSSSVLRNLLKGPMEERKFKDGYEVLDMPLQMVVGASNSIIEYKKDATEAAFADRWLARVHVTRIQRPENQLRLLDLRWENPDWPKIDPAVIYRLQSLMGKVKVSPTIKQTYLQMRQDIYSDPSAGNLDMSDRRFEHTFLLARASAILNGRLTMKRSDLKVYGLTAWNNHVEHEDSKLHTWLQAKLASALAEVESYEKQLDDAYQAYEASKTELDPDPAFILQSGIATSKHLDIISKNLSRLRPRLEDDDEIEAANKIEAKLSKYSQAVLADTEQFSGDVDLSSLKK